MLIKNTFSSLSNKNDDEKSTDTPSQRKKRVHKAGDKIIIQNKKDTLLKTIGPGNFNKKTYCYKMTTGDNTQYFVKIFEGNFFFFSFFFFEKHMLFIILLCDEY